MLPTVLIALAAWVGLAAACAASFALGAGAGRRRGFEEGFEVGVEEGLEEGLKQARSLAPAQEELVIPDVAEARRSS
jgi:flagellar biosynthesis/type III secretory pathway protein FliH